jgi:hypothetical protein
LPNAYAGHAGELDLAAGVLDRDARPGFGSARPGTSSVLPRIFLPVTSDHDQETP